jgi:hypothetical protein
VSLSFTKISKIEQSSNRKTSKKTERKKAKLQEQNPSPKDKLKLKKKNRRQNRREKGIEAEDDVNTSSFSSQALIP